MFLNLNDLENIPRYQGYQLFATGVLPTTLLMTKRCVDYFLKTQNTNGSMIFANTNDGKDFWGHKGI